MSCAIKTFWHGVQNKSKVWINFIFDFIQKIEFSKCFAIFRCWDIGIFTFSYTAFFQVDFDWWQHCFAFIAWLISPGRRNLLTIRCLEIDDAEFFNYFYLQAFSRETYFDTDFNIYWILTCMFPWKGLVLKDNIIKRKVWFGWLVPWMGVWNASSLKFHRLKGYGVKAMVSDSSQIRGINLQKWVDFSTGEISDQNLISATEREQENKQEQAILTSATI